MSFHSDARPTTAANTAPTTAATTPHGATRVFVYGTLRRGQRNHDALRGARFVGAAATVSRYTLRVDGLLPYLDPREARYPVRGEVYEIGKAMLRALDHLEGHPAWYRRRVIPVHLDHYAPGATREVVDAFAYFHAHAPGVVHPTGDFAQPMEEAVSRRAFGFG